MKTKTEHLREHLYENLGYFEPEEKPSLEELKKTEWSTQFETYMRNRLVYMRNRLVMGALRYGLINHAGKSKYNRIDSIGQRLDLYRESGNQEHLVDIANLCLLEFEEPAHSEAHWEAQDDTKHVEEL